jgi:hypothetical protein
LERLEPAAARVARRGWCGARPRGRRRSRVGAGDPVAPKLWVGALAWRRSRGGRARTSAKSSRGLHHTWTDYAAGRSWVRASLLNEGLLNQPISGCP